MLAIAVLLVLLGGLLAWRPAVFLRAGLRLAGHEEISFDHLRVGLHRLELTGLAVGGRSRPEQLVGRLTIDYRPGDLLRGRIEAVSVEGRDAARPRRPGRPAPGGHGSRGGGI